MAKHLSWNHTPLTLNFHLHEDDEILHVGEIRAQGSQLLRQLLGEA